MLAAIFYVYVMFRPWDGTPFYVGKGKGGRSARHAYEAKKQIHKNSIVQRIFDKAQRFEQEVPIVFVGEALTEPEAFILEIALIQALGRKANGGPLANLTDGGEGCSGLTRLPLSDDAKQRISDAAKLRVGDKNHFYGKVHSEASKAKISAALMGRESTMKGIKGETHHWWGRKHTDAHKQYMSERMTGRVISEETRQKLREADCGKSTRGTCWWTQPNGRAYRSVEARGSEDVQGRPSWR